ncbi:MAG: hypothetical protein ABUL63_03160, partial [Acidobacteriota bacterium]
MGPIQAASLSAFAAALLTAGCASAPARPNPSAAPATPPILKVPPPVTIPVGSESAPGAILYTWAQVVPGGTRMPGGTVELARAV